MVNFSPVRGKRLRVTALDDCGNVPEPDAEDSVVTTNGFISVSLSAEVEDGVEIVTRRADGSLCVNEKFASSFKSFNAEIEFCGVDPGLLGLTTNAEGYEDYDNLVSGIVVPEGTIDKKFAFELWTGLSGRACEPGVEEASGYMLLPFVQAGVLGDFTVDGENAVSFTMTGAFTKGGNNWGAGPYNVLHNGAVASPLPTALDPLDHFLLVPTNIAPPANADGLQPFTPDTPPSP